MYRPSSEGQMLIHQHSILASSKHMALEQLQETLSNAKQSTKFFVLEGKIRF
jgi:hypothetical protein